MAIEIRPRRNRNLQHPRLKEFVSRSRMVNTKRNYNLSIHTRRTVVKVPPKMARDNFWLSVMNPARKETTFMTQIMVGGVSVYMLEYLITHRGDNEDDSCPGIDKILGIEILYFV